MEVVVVEFFNGLLGTMLVLWLLMSINYLGSMIFVGLVRVFLDLEIHVRRFVDGD